MSYFLGLLVALGSVVGALNHMPVNPQYCMKGWTITGYYLPSQNDFSNWNDFFADVQMQGSGQLSDGRYINWLGQIVDQPTTASGIPVQEGVVAFDPRYFPYGTIFWVNGNKYVALDTGGAILGPHLDIYTGVGRDAQQRAFDLTAFNQTVCWSNPQ